MSFQAMASIGDRMECRICGKEVIAEFVYHFRGACGSCVRRLAHEYSMAHSGAPVFGFSTDDEMAEHSKRMTPHYRKSPIPSKLRKEIFERDAYRCKKCGSHHDLHVDHIFPESRGGKAVLENLQTLCAPCNIAKGASIE